MSCSVTAPNGGIGYPFGGEAAQRDEEWPRPRQLWGCHIYGDALLLERAPFTCAEGLREAKVIRRYAAATGELPGGLSLSAVLSRDFTHCLVVEPELLRSGYRRVNTEAKVALVELVRQRIRRAPCNRLLPRAWDMDTWACRCDADRGYVTILKRIPDNLSAREEVPSVSLMAWGRRTSLQGSKIVPSD